MFWLQPLNRIAARGLVDAAEPVCDELGAIVNRKPLWRWLVASVAIYPIG